MWASVSIYSSSCWSVNNSRIISSLTFTNWWNSWKLLWETRRTMTTKINFGFKTWTNMLSIIIERWNNDNSNKGCNRTIKNAGNKVTILNIYLPNKNTKKCKLSKAFCFFNTFFIVLNFHFWYFVWNRYQNVIFFRIYACFLFIFLLRKGGYLIR